MSQVSFFAFVPKVKSQPQEHRDGQDISYAGCVHGNSLLGVDEFSHSERDWIVPTDEKSVE